MNSEQQNTENHWKNLQQFDFKNIPIKSHTYGVATARFNALLQINENQILVPTGLNLCVYDIQTFQRQRVLHYNQSAIFVLIENKDYIFSITFSGEIAIIDKKTLKLLKTTYSQGREVRYASVNDRYLCLSCEIFNNQTNGCIEVYDLQQILINEDNNQNKVQIQNACVFQIEGRYRYAMLVENDIALQKQILAALENPCNLEHKKEKQDQLQQNQQIITHDNHEKINHYLVKLNFEKNNNETMVNKVHLPFIGDIIYAGQENNIAFYLYSTRELLIIDIANGSEQPIYFGRIEGSGSIMSCNIQDSVAYISPQNNKLLKIYLPNSEQIKNLDKNNLKQLLNGVNIPINEQNNLNNNTNNQEKFTNLYYEVQELKTSAVQPRNYFMKWNQPQKQFFVFNEDGLILYDYENQKTKTSLQHANITCVGLAVHPQEHLLAVGDMVGNLYLYPVEEDLQGQIQKQVWVMGAIRCLGWSPCGQYIYIGCMDGNIFRWDYNNSSETDLIVTLPGTITSIRPQQIQDEVRYLITDTSGTVTIFTNLNNFKGEQNKIDDFRLNSFIAHKAIPKEKIANPNRFGSLHIKAEIWNSIWGYNSFENFATCSEDQSGHIFDLKQLNNQSNDPQHILSGQQLAVTCVDWQEMGEGIGEMYVQCSDDRSVRFYDPKNEFKLIFEISTQFVQEWHTLTYLALQKGGTKVAIGGQSGFLFVFDIKLMKWVYAEKIHLGGIEGLVWEKNKLITCSSDCCVNVQEF